MIIKIICIFGVMEILNNIIQPIVFEDVSTIFLAWFIGFVLSEQIGISYWIKKLFRIKLTREIKILDCYPCFSFWVALGLSLNLYIAIIVYFIAIKIDKDGRN